MIVSSSENDVSSGSSSQPSTTPVAGSSGAAAAGTNHTSLPSPSRSAPHASLKLATIARPRPNVGSSSMKSGTGSSEVRAGGSAEASRTSTRGWSRVPRSRTVTGPLPCRIALVTTSDMASSAFSRRSLRPISRQTSATQRRA